MIYNDCSNGDHTSNEKKYYKRRQSKKDKKKYYQRRWREKQYKKEINLIFLMDKNDQTQYLSSMHGSKRASLIKRIKKTKNKILKDEVFTNIKKKIKKHKKENLLKRISNKWEFVKSYLRTHPCDCGVKEIEKLTFHHLDPTKKEGNIRHMCRYSINRLIEEIQKCEVRCYNCHILIHNGNSREQKNHLLNNYLNKDSKKKQRARNRLYLLYHKDEQVCLKCGEKESACLVPHYVNSISRNGRISTLIKNSIEKTNKELSKCIYLCQNCHMQFTHRYGLDNSKDELEEYLGIEIHTKKVDIRVYKDKLIEEIQNRTVKS